MMHVVKLRHFSAENIEKLCRQYANLVRSSPEREPIYCTPAVLVLWHLEIKLMFLCFLRYRKRQTRQATLYARRPIGETVPFFIRIHVGP